MRFIQLYTKWSGWWLSNWNGQVVNRRADRRPTVSTRCQESARDAIAYQLMKFPFHSKKTPVGCLETFIVVLSCRYFSRPQPSLLAPKKPIPGVQIVGQWKEKQQKKNVVARERRGRNPPLSQFLSFAFFPLRSPLSEHLKQASARSNATIHKQKYFIPLHNEHKELWRFQKQF